MQISEVQTPAALLDRSRFEANCRRMIETIHTRGTRLRPHMKTLKSIDAARIAIDPSHGGIAVATLNEAEYFAAHGIRDICIAVCLSPDKMPRASRLCKKSSVSLFVDSLDTAAALAASPAPLGAWIEIDCGEHRTGVAPDDDTLLQIAGVLGPRLVGVATHGGQSYLATSPDEIAHIAEIERHAVVSAAQRLRAQGHTVNKISAGSTPTAAHSRSWEGVTEVRAGVYMAGDLVQADLGSLDSQAIAFSVLATVISANAGKGQVIIDAGGLALSKDKGNGRWGYGKLVPPRGSSELAGIIVSDVHQEHGELRGLLPGQVAMMPVGTKVRIIPNHVCMTAAMYDELLLCDGDEVIAQWPRTNGWQAG